MKWTSIAAIYFLFFVASAFLLLPFGVKTDEEAGNPLVADTSQPGNLLFTFTAGASVSWQGHLGGLAGGALGGARVLAAAGPHATGAGRVHSVMRARRLQRKGRGVLLLLRSWTTHMRLTC